MNDLKIALDPKIILNITLDLLRQLPREEWALQGKKDLQEWEKKLIETWNKPGGLTQEDREKLASNYSLKSSYLKRRDSDLRQLIKKMLVSPGDKYQEKRLTNKIIQELLKREIESSFSEGLYEIPLSLTSRFYINRPEIELKIYKYLTQPHSLLHLVSERKSGNTSSLERILAQLKVSQKYRTVYLNLSVLFEDKKLDNFDFLAQTFAVAVGERLGLPNKLTELWDSDIAATINLQSYCENCWSEAIATTLIICLDRADKIFTTKAGIHFFSYVRYLYELGKNDPFWSRVRFVLIYSQDSPKIPTEKSPFNVGKKMALPDFQIPEVIQLASKYHLDYKQTEANQIIEVLGGKPYFLRYAFRDIVLHKLSLTDFLNSSRPRSILAKFKDF